jgi:hypothetical protein
MINLQIAKIRKFEGKSSASGPDLHWFASNIIFKPWLVYFRLRNAL